MVCVYTFYTFVHEPQIITVVERFADLYADLTSSFINMKYLLFLALLIINQIKNLDFRPLT